MSLPLGDIDVKLSNGVGVMDNTVGLDDGHRMVLNTEAVLRKGGGVDQAHTVSKTGLDVDDGPRNLRSTVETTGTIDETGIGNGLESTTVIRAEVQSLEMRSEVVIPFVEFDDSASVVNVVQWKSGVFGVC